MKAITFLSKSPASVFRHIHRLLSMSRLDSELLHNKNILIHNNYDFFMNLSIFGPRMHIVGITPLSCIIHTL